MTMVGQRIRELRKEKGMTQQELADKAGVDVSYLSLIETGRKQNPTITFLARIAAVLGVDIETLLKEGEGDE